MTNSEGKSKFQVLFNDAKNCNLVPGNAKDTDKLNTINLKHLYCLCVVNHYPCGLNLYKSFAI